MTPDPPIREDGLCAVCLGQRKPAGLKPLYRNAFERDPFCSTECARRWHGVPLAGARPEMAR